MTELNSTPFLEEDPKDHDRWRLGGVDAGGGWGWPLRTRGFSGVLGVLRGARARGARVRAHGGGQCGRKWDLLEVKFYLQQSIAILAAARVT